MAGGAGRHYRWVTAGWLGLACAGWSTGVRAGAFNLPEGDGLAIADVTFSDGNRYFNGSGKIAKATAYERADASVYVEYGVTDWLMAVLRPDLTAVAMAGTPPPHYFGLGPSEAGLQARLITFGPAVVAVQGTFRFPGSTDLHNPALVGTTSHDVDGRALLGISFDVGGLPAFVDAQAGYRYRDGHAPDEIRADLSFGIRPWDPLLLLLQSFNSVPVEKGAPGYPAATYSHLELAAVYDLSDAWSVELGAYTTILGRQALRERGLQTAVWYRF